MPMGKMCQVCESEPGEATCEKCGKLMGKNCSKGNMCKSCVSGMK